MKHYLSIFLILSLALLACRAVLGADNPAGVVLEDPPLSTETNSQLATPAITEEPPGITSPQTAAPPETGSAPAATDPTLTTGGPQPQSSPPPSINKPPQSTAKPPQSQAAEIRPPERRAELSRLSSLLGFQVISQDGVLLGTAADFILNTCETYLIYFVLEPARSLNIDPGSRLIIPYEIVTINSGVLDAEAGAILLAVGSGQVAAAPAAPAGLELFPTGWEADARAYWSQVARVSKLTTECQVAAPGGGTVAIQKIAYFTELLGAELKDGQQNVLGTVEEAILAPESGKLAFFVVNLQEEQALVLVPLRVVNIPEAALAPEAALELVLLTETDRLLNAPRIASLEEAVQDAAQGQAIQHWRR